MALHFVGVGNDGKLYHTIRYSDGHWQADFGAVQSQSHGGPARYRSVSAASSDGKELQVVGLGEDGKLWHTIRHVDGTWAADFGLVEGQSHGGPTTFSAVSCSVGSE